MIIHAECAVLAGHVRRSQGGLAVADHDAFACALDELAEHPDAAAERGRRGRAYVEAHYAVRDAYRARLERAIANLGVPLCEQMRLRGLERAARCERAAWRDAVGRIVEELLDTAPRPYRRAVAVTSLNDAVHARLGTRTTLVAVRVHNHGTHAVVAAGPARTVLNAEVRDPHTDSVVGTANTELAGLLMPGATQTAMLLVPVPPEPGAYDLHVGAAGSEPLCVPLHVGNEPASGAGLAPLLDGMRELLVQARQAQRLPDDYIDVTEGWFARAKRWVKKKLLYNFKRAYVDVLSRQQSQVNEQLVAAVQQLAECCATLDHAVHGLQRRLDQSLPSPPHPYPSPPQGRGVGVRGRGVGGEGAGLCAGSPPHPQPLSPAGERGETHAEGDDDT